MSQSEIIDLSTITSKFNETQSIKLAKVMHLSYAELLQFVLKNIDKVNI